MSDPLMEDPAQNSLPHHPDKVEARRGFGCISLIFKIIFLSFRRAFRFAPTIARTIDLFVVRIPEFYIFPEREYKKEPTGNPSTEDLTGKTLYHRCSDEARAKAMRDFIRIMSILLSFCIVLAFFALHSSFLDMAAQAYRCGTEDWGFLATTLLGLIVKFLLSLFLCSWNQIAGVNYSILLFSILADVELHKEPISSKRWLAIFRSVGAGIILNVMSIMYVLLRRKTLTGLHNLAGR